MNLILRIWRQAGPDAPGGFQTYEARGVSGAMPFLELLDALNGPLHSMGGRWKRSGRPTATD